MKKKSFAEPSTYVGKFFKNLASIKNGYAVVLAYNASTYQFVYEAFWVDDNMYGEPEFCFATLKEDHEIFLASYKEISKAKITKVLDKGFAQLIDNHTKALKRFTTVSMVVNRVFKEPYPAWICSDCGNKYGSTLEGSVSTFHTPSQGESCGWCGSTENALTEPRDYRYPPMVPKV